MTEPVDRAAELELTRGCARGDPAALATFEAQHRGDLARIAARFAAPGLGADDAEQIVREKLLCGPAPRIARYDGRGSLRNWLRAAAVRALIDDARARRREPAIPGLGADDVLDGLAAPGDDPALDHLRRTYRGEFKAAFAEAVAGLDPAERTAIRYAYVHGLTADQLAVVYGCHRATAARKVAAARDALLGATRRALRDRLGVAADAVDSILRLVESQIDVSLPRLLASVGDQYE